MAVLIPVGAVLKLNMSTRRKCSVGAVFCIGLSACIVDGVGIKFRVESANPRIPMEDQVWKGTQLILIFMAELAMILIVTCSTYVPRIKQILQQNRAPVTIDSYDTGRTSVPTSIGNLRDSSLHRSQSKKSKAGSSTSVEDIEMGDAIGNQKKPDVQDIYNFCRSNMLTTAQHKLTCHSENYHSHGWSYQKSGCSGYL